MFFSHWVVLVCVALAFLILIWSMAKLLFKAALVVMVAASLVFVLNYFSLLPKEAQKYLEEMVSEANVEKACSWVSSLWSGGSAEESSRVSDQTDFSPSE
jgi:hypothetical protein